MKRSALVWGILVVLATGACSDKPFFGSKKTSDPFADEPEAPAAAPAPTAQRPVVIDMTGRPMSFAPLVEKADGSVATVRAVTRRGEGFGTAFVYDASGYLLTNHHVIEGAREITVGFKDGRMLKGTVVGSDARTDVAVLKVSANGDLPALPLGDSEELLVGDWVVAIGNPFGLEHTVSAGILSAKGRTREDVKGLDKEGYFDFLQTDCSINPGNSGGPLLNLKGEVIGINSAIRANANTIAFSIPINMVKQLTPILVKEGKVRRSALGVVVDNISFEQAERLGRTTTKGAWVKGMQGGGPAANGGIELDDVIVAFNGRPVGSPNDLRWHASIGGVGQVATVRVARGKKELDLKVTLGALPGTDD